MNNYKKEIGKKGEDLATKFLIEKGYEIIVRNKKISHQEIDIIASIGTKTVFVEVKTRSREDLGGAEEAVDATKIKNMQKAIMGYSREHKLCIDDVDIEVISVYINKYDNSAKIRHYTEVL